MSLLFLLFGPQLCPLELHSCFYSFMCSSVTPDTGFHSLHLLLTLLSKKRQL